MKLSTRLTIRYIAALTIIAALLTTTYINLHYLITTEESSSSLINISGRQRMLTMRAALLSLQLAHTEEKTARDGIRQQLYQTADQLSQSHQLLKNTSTTYALDDAISMYVTSVRNWAGTSDAQLSASSPELQFILGAASGPLIQGLEAVVSDRQRESEHKIAEIRHFETLMFIIGLLVLLGEALYIFRPAVNTIQAERKALEAVNEELHRLSSLDGLTGIANRRYFDSYLVQAWNQNKRDSHEISLVMLDVDFFKLFNDAYGHLAGDDCLRQVAQVISANVKRPADLAARYGGEEFALIMPDTSMAGAQTVAENIRQAIENLGIPHQKSAVNDVVTISMGIACVNPVEELTPEILIQVADYALYEAKKNGRNQVYAEKMNNNYQRGGK